MISPSPTALRRPAGAGVDFDVVIVGFGFSGLAVLAHLTRERPELRIAVIADDDRGHGLAYGTRDPGHLLNVVAERMGIWDDDPAHFAAWLSSPAAAAAAAELGVALPGPEDFAPRALFASYLSDVRRQTLDRAGPQVTVIPGRARALRRVDTAWEIIGDAHLRAGACVLATGHEAQRVLGPLEHPRLHAGPWDLPRVAAGRDPVLLVGSGLTAVDAVMTLRRGGYAGPILAASRNGRLPAAHVTDAPAFELSAAEADELRSVADVVAFIRRGHPDGGWRAALDALRPHTVRLWQRLDPAAQRAAAGRWGGLWSVHRHRMAPPIARRIERELAVGGLRVVRIDSLQAETSGDELVIRVRPRGEAEPVVLRPPAVIDCTGPQLQVTRTDQPLLRSLLDAGVVRPHGTGLGLVADDDHRIGPDLYALGPLLVGERWESIAVPELRESAAAIERSLRDAGSLLHDAVAA